MTNLRGQRNFLKNTGPLIRLPQVFKNWGGGNGQAELSSDRRETITEDTFSSREFELCQLTMYKGIIPSIFMLVECV